MGENVVLARYRLHMQAAGLSPRTIETREQLLAVFLQGRRPDEVSRDDVIGFLANPDYAAGTRSNYFSMLRGFFDWTLAEQLIAEHPMVGMVKPRKPPCVPHPVSNEQLARVLATPMRPAVRVQILLAAYAGLRVHEIAKLHADDYQERRLRVRGKGGRVDEIPVPVLLGNVLDDMPTSGFWFPHHAEPNRPISRKSVTDAIRKVMRRAGVNASAHALRHWYATTLLREGVDIRVVQSLMRHASLGTTAGYLAITSAARDAAVEQLPVAA